MGTAAGDGKAPSGAARASRAWLLSLTVALGALAGAGGYTFRYARGLSYLSTDPKACVNCHIMQSQYDNWQRASHHTAAVCIDCHLPVSFIAKYLAKAENGWRHGERFTTQNFHEPIVVQAAGQRILQDNCVRCHGAIVENMTRGARVGTHADEQARCLHCHAGVGHGERTGLGGPLRASELPALPTTSK